MSLFTNLKNKKICVFGLGYVGLPLAIELRKKYYTVGFDINIKRINDLKQAEDKTLEVSSKELKDSNLIFTTNAENIKDCDVFIATVPTPVNQNNTPDFNPLLSASRAIGRILKKENIVIYESTVYPGATENLCVPILEEESGLKYNKDFFCGYSPERINPGDKKHTLTRITKITSGSNREAADFVDKLYKSIIKAGTHKVSSIAIAEAAKVIENIQRDVNIALTNEFSMIFNKLNLSTNEILEAAGTKWNFLPFRPGLVGGHCIGVDPYYLTHRAAEIGYHPEMILAGRRINDQMSQYISDITIRKMTELKINPIKSNIAVLGLTFKENCPDLRNTKVKVIIDNLLKYNCNIIVSDPFADPVEVRKNFNLNLESFEKLKNIDVVILAVGHTAYKNISLNSWKNYFGDKGLFIDVKSIYKSDFFDKSKINHWSL